MHTRLDRSSSVRLLAVSLMSLVAGACGDDGDSKGGQKSSNYAPSRADGKSDGTAGGDLVALQIRQSELACECAGDAEVQDICMDFAWPDGQAECIREALNARPSINVRAFACAEQSVREAIDCLTKASCNQDAVGKCQSAFSEAQQKCTQFDQQTQDQGLMCTDFGTGGGSDSDDWDEDDWCANADLCDGFEDCADGSDEADCD